MAGDWIPMRSSLYEDPSVLVISRQTNLDEFAVVGRLHRLWSWFDANTTNGHVGNADVTLIDALVHSEGFASAMVSAGWLRVTPEGVEMPHFARYHGKCAKRRELTLKRVRKYREKKRNAGNALQRVTCNAGNAIREEKRREEETTTPLTPQGGAPKRVRKVRSFDYSADFLAFWNAYPRKEGKGVAWKSWTDNGAYLDPPAVMAGLVKWLASESWAEEGGKYVQHASRWLNGRMWEDSPKPVHGGAGLTVKKVRVADVPPGHPCHGHKAGEEWVVGDYAYRLTRDGMWNKAPHPDGSWGPSWEKVALKEEVVHA